MQDAHGLPRVSVNLRFVLMHSGFLTQESIKSANSVADVQCALHVWCIVHSVATLWVLCCSAQSGILTYRYSGK